MSLLPPSQAVMNNDANTPNVISSARISRNRYCPYGKTPQSRSVRKRATATTPQRRKSHGNRKQQSKDHSRLLNKIWQSYALTELYNFNCSQESLETYSHHLTAWLQSTSVKGNDEKTTHGIKVEIKVLHRNSSTSSMTVQISVKGSSLSHRFRQNSSPDKEHEYFTGIMSSINVANDDTTAADVSTRSTWFPVLLARGPVLFVKQVLNFLMEKFDSTIWEMNFASHELEWMVAMWPNNTLDDSDGKSIQLLYNVPNNKNLQKLNYFVDPRSIDNIWKCIHDKDSEEIYFDEVKKLFDHIQQHFLYMFRINLSKLSLSAVGTSALTAHKKGKLKIYSEEDALNIIQHITSLNPLTSKS